MGNEDGIFKESQVNDQVAFNEDYAKTLSGKRKIIKIKMIFLMNKLLIILVIFQNGMKLLKNSQDIGVQKLILLH
ncbi:hypothetical protein SD457_11720 [Coprobacillaceae bacterium CR2/5/TPMF4]|nr:hypothetical protein SD457_11720 [Coprobacillaceae bacterium CR2/5/TPMF4]